MDLRSILSQRLGMDDVKEIASIAERDVRLRSELYEFAFDSEDRLSVNALWVMTHSLPITARWLCSKQNELVDELLVSKHTSKKRLLLSLIYKQPLPDPLRIDFLDYCLDLTISRKEPYGVTALCMKLAYEMCKTIPELLLEYHVILEMMEPSLLPASLQVTRRNILQETEALEPVHARDSSCC